MNMFDRWKSDDDYYHETHPEALKQYVAKRNIIMKNSIYTYVLGDCLGVPFEFATQGSFKCKKISGYGTHNQPPGTWSDDTSILLCLLDALSYDDNAVDRYKENLKEWFYNGRFSCDGKLFDIGNQTRLSIKSNFTLMNENLKGNGALFYSLPLALYFIKIRTSSSTLIRDHDLTKRFVQVTHNSEECIKYAILFMEDIYKYFCFNPKFKPFICYNAGDVKNTYEFIINNISKLSTRTNLFTDLCTIVNYGNDTDTNAALAGGLIGMRKKVSSTHLNQIRNREIIDMVIDKFLEGK